MIPLRILAILSSVLFLIYGVIMQVGPLIVMEVILLPINIFRYWQLVSLRSKLKNSLAEERTDFSVIKTYGKRLRFEAGDFVFRKGDAVDNLYYVDKGHVQIGNDKTLKSGDVFGDLAFFQMPGFDPPRCSV
jgi:CRP-like cAMP-binding protein